MIYSPRILSLSTEMKVKILRVPFSLHFISLNNQNICYVVSRTRNDKTVHIIEIFVIYRFILGVFKIRNSNFTENINNH